MEQELYWAIEAINNLLATGEGYISGHGAREDGSYAVYAVEDYTDDQGQRVYNERNYLIPAAFVHQLNLS